MNSAAPQEILSLFLAPTVMASTAYSNGRSEACPRMTSRKIEEAVVNHVGEQRDIRHLQNMQAPLEAFHEAMEHLPPICRLQHGLNFGETPADLLVFPAHLVQCSLSIPPPC